MFEQRILCHALPNSFNSTPSKKDETSCTNQQTDKSVQDLKRQALHRKLEQYELRIHQCAKLYDQAFARFQSETCNTFSSHHFGSFTELMHCVKNYVHQHTKLFLRRIRYTESSFHVKLLRQHSAHCRSTRMNKTVDVYPRIIVDVPHVALNARQLDYLSRAGQFVYFKFTLRIFFSSI